MALLTNNLSRQIKSLDERKHRRREQAFKAEGSKCVLDTLPFFNVRYLFATKAWIEENKVQLKHCLTEDSLTECSPAEIAKMSSLVTPTDVIAVYDIPEMKFERGIAARQEPLIVSVLKSSRPQWVLSQESVCTMVIWLK